jgi:pyruvate dehydrogenase E1 component beta subunit
MVPIAMRAAEQLNLDGINVEVIDLRSAAPMDKEAIFKSVAKTGRLVVADTAWQSFGVSAEISASVAEHILDSLKAPIVRVALPDTHAPTSSALEALFYPDDDDVVEAVRTVLKQ